MALASMPSSGCRSSCQCTREFDSVPRKAHEKQNKLLIKFKNLSAQFGRRSEEAEKMKGESYFWCTMEMSEPFRLIVGAGKLVIK